MNAIILPGEPIAQKRPRIFAKGAMDPCWEAKEQHRSYIRKHYPDIKPMTGAIHLILVFSYEYPKSWSQKKRVPSWKTTRPDRDNLGKYIEDMGKGLLWDDDSLIVCGPPFKLYTGEDRVLILYREANEDDMFQVLALLGAYVRPVL